MFVIDDCALGHLPDFVKDTVRKRPAIVGNYHAAVRIVGNNNALADQASAELVLLKNEEHLGILDGEAGGYGALFAPSEGTIEILIWCEWAVQVFGVAGLLGETGIIVLHESRQHLVGRRVRRLGL